MRTQEVHRSEHFPIVETAVALVPNVVEVVAASFALSGFVDRDSFFEASGVFPSSWAALLLR